MKRFGFIALVMVGIGLLSGCQSGPDAGYLAASQEISHIRKSIRESRNPHTFVVNARKYALEKMRDITDSEADIVQDKKPVIDSNFDGSEYSFIWKIAKHHLIEVVTTPPPCQPIAVYRVRRTYYP
jgi:hypothetical protein